MDGMGWDGIRVVVGIEHLMVLIIQYKYITILFSIVVWSYYAYFVAVVLNAMAPSPAEQVSLEAV